MYIVIKYKRNTVNRIKKIIKKIDLPLATCYIQIAAYKHQSLVFTHQQKQEKPQIFFVRLQLTA